MFVLILKHLKYNEILQDINLILSFYLSILKTKNLNFKALGITNSQELRDYKQNLDKERLKIF